jgi:hypothetical protein
VCTGVEGWIGTVHVIVSVRSLSIVAGRCARLQYPPCVPEGVVKFVKEFVLPNSNHIPLTAPFDSTLRCRVCVAVARVAVWCGR